MELVRPVGWHPTGLRIGAVIGGVLVAAVVQVLLMTLGAAVGLTAFSAADQTQTEVQVGYAAWLVLSLFASVLIGSMVSSAGSRSPWRRDGLLHGVVTWAAIGLVGFFLVGYKLDDVLGGALRLAGRTAQASAATPEASRMIEEQRAAAAREVQTQVQGTVDQVKQAVTEVGTGLQAAQAADDTRQGIAIGLWSLLGVEGLLLLAALIGGALGCGPMRRTLRREALAARRLEEEIAPPVDVRPPVESSPGQRRAELRSRPGAEHKVGPEGLRPSPT